MASSEKGEEREKEKEKKEDEAQKEATVEEVQRGHHKLVFDKVLRRRKAKEVKDVPKRDKPWESLGSVFLPGAELATCQPCSREGPERERLVRSQATKEESPKHGSTSQKSACFLGVLLALRLDFGVAGDANMCLEDFENSFWL